MSLSLLPIAYADTVNAAPVAPHTANGLSLVIWLVALIVIFYFILWRPQNKRMKEQRQLLTNLAVGDEVVTAGGIVGRITKLSDDFLTLLIAEHVEITVQKSSISSLLPKGTLKSV